MTRVVIVIQARMGSTRLPNKALLSLRGAPLIDWVLRRVLRAAQAHATVLAIPEGPLDDLLADRGNEFGVKVYRGSEGDVLGRIHGAAQLVDATHVVRICADNPLVSPAQIDVLVERFLTAHGWDYAYNHIPRRNKYPDGLGAEMCTMGTLHRLHEQVTLPAHREHCFNHLWDNAASFSMHTFDPPDKRLHHPELKLDVDTIDDLHRLWKSGATPKSTDLEIVEAFSSTAVRR